MSLNKIRVNDIDIAYRWDGQSSGPVVMMAHAMGTSHRIWDLQMDALASDFRVLRYDWRGHGDTDAPPGPYSLQQFVEDAVGLMDALGLERVHWVGISTGGMIGQGLGIHAAERISSLTLCNTTSFAGPWYKDWVAERQAVVRSGGMQPVWEMTKTLWFTDDFVASAGSDYTLIRDVFIATPVDGYLGGTSAVTHLAYTDDLHKIEAPTHVIAAGDDPVTPVEHSQSIANEISNSRLSVLEGQRHFSNVEMPGAFNDLLVSGLKAHR